MTPNSKVQFVVHNQGFVSSIVGSVTLDLKPVLKTHNGNSENELYCIMY